jgi:hypothetical protein
LGVRNLESCCAGCEEGQAGIGLFVLRLHCGNEAFSGVGRLVGGEKILRAGTHVKTQSFKGLSVGNLKSCCVGREEERVSIGSFVLGLYCGNEAFSGVGRLIGGEKKRRVTEGAGGDPIIQGFECQKSQKLLCGT